MDNGEGSSKDIRRERLEALEIDREMWWQMCLKDELNKIKYRERSEILQIRWEEYIYKKPETTRNITGSIKP